MRRQALALIALLLILRLPVVGQQYFPAMGNHDTGYHYRRAILDTIIPAQVASLAGARRKELVLRDNCAANYHVDWKNVRTIVVDQYSCPFGHPEGSINAAGVAWIEGLVVDAERRDGIDHIFVVGHEPAFPRKRHHEDSLNQYEGERDDFWNMLRRHKGKVRAYLVGHTHHYSRMRVDDVDQGKAGSPNDPAGIFQIDVGAAGHQTNTVVQFLVDGESVLCRALKADLGPGKPFKMTDQFLVAGSTKEVSDQAWSFAAISDHRTVFEWYRWLLPWNAVAKVMTLGKYNPAEKKRRSYENALVELRDQATNPEPGFTPIEYILAIGDLDPVGKNYRDIYKQVFPNAP